MESKKKKSLKKYFGRIVGSTEPDEEMEKDIKTLDKNIARTLDFVQVDVDLGLSDEQRDIEFANWPASTNRAFFYSSPLRARSTQTRTSTGVDPIRTSIEEMVDTRMAENMPIFERIVDSMIKKRFDKIQESGIHEVLSPVNVFDLTKEDVKETILNATKIGDVFYPSDIANQFGLELKTVVAVIEELKREGKISESPHQK